MVSFEAGDTSQNASERTNAKEGPAAAPQFEAFISYSHAADGTLAPALQKELQHFGRSWNRSRARRVFLDNANLSANPQLWEAIKIELGSSAWFVLLASPAAAQSVWVEREVQWWLDKRGLDGFLIVLTDGEFVWHPGSDRLDKNGTTALPQALIARLNEQPRLVDLRWIREENQIDPANPKFRDCVAEIAATIRGVQKDTLVGEHVRRQKQIKRLVRGVIASLSILLIIAVVSAVVAVVQQRSARAQALTATSRQLVAEASTIRDSQPNLARQLLVQAYRFAPTAQAVGALLASSSIPRVIATSGPASDVAFSPHRDILAVGSEGGVTLHDANTMQPLAPPLDSGYVVEFSPDDHLLAVGNGVTVGIWDVTSATQPLRRGTMVAAKGVEAVAFSSESAIIAIAEGASEVSVWDIKDLDKPAKLATIPGFDTSGLGTGIAISPRGGVLAISGKDNTVGLWDIATASHPTFLTELIGHTGWVSTIAFSPAGNLLATGGSDDTTRLWNLADAAHPQAGAVLSGHSFGIDQVSFASDGITLATAGGDRRLQLWDISDPVRPKLGATLTGHVDVIDGLAFSPDGHALASASRDGVRLWSVAASGRSTASALLSIGTSSEPTFTADGRTIAAGFPTTLWDITDRTRPITLGTLPTFNQGGQTVAFSADDRKLVTGIPVIVWDVTDPRHPHSLTPDTALTDGANVVRFSPTAPIVAVGTLLDPVELWDISSSEEPTLVSKLSESESTANGVTFAPAGNILATLTTDGAVQLWDVGDASDPKVVATVSTSNKFTAVTFTPGGRSMITGADDGIISIWDIEDVSHPSRLTSVSRHTDAVVSLVHHPASEMMASTSEDGTLRLWDMQELSRPQELTVLGAGGAFDYGYLTFSPNGKSLAATSIEGILIWDTDINGILQRLCTESTSITQSEWRQYLPAETFDPPCM